MKILIQAIFIMVARQTHLNQNTFAMETKQSAMHIMLNELKYKQFIYEKAGMYESATALVTSIELAEQLIQIEKEQIFDAHFEGWGDAYDYLRDEHCDARQAHDYYFETYGK